uniref:1-acyl-sn-glycerol-3-phosphate acyltransferase epsilon n=1 Tax=Ciona intestinalis TaxID=7719 RepID=UPI000052195A|nr:1-acyl-sn-glycerol-3-phosphate acyltransferase epsilon [Ciona intestinalis]|eukprot:XP_002131887.1 1-acyl-sn-glycerol-3-phosphate acyltransferase epsilon [Ciona intestinalis]
MSVLASLVRCLVACFACLVIFCSVPVYVVLLVSWMVISIPLPETWFHIMEDGLWGWYQSVVVFFFEHCTGVELYIEGNIPKIKENCIVISNHQCLVDWIVADFVAIRQGMVGHMRYVFKNSLKYYPLYGFGFGVHGGVFVRRDGKYNDDNMKKTLNKLIRRKTNLYFLVYPEGTRFSPARKDLLEKSQSFATKAGLQPLSQVLTPRVKAFECTLNTLRHHVHAVYDITVIYEGMQKHTKGDKRLVAPTTWQFITGKCRRVYIRFERFPIDDVVNSITSLKSDNPDTSGCMLWLHERFSSKDKLLKDFYENDETSSQAMQKKASPLSNGSRCVLPLSQTLPSALSIMILTSMMLYFPLTRSLMICISTFGTALCGFYAHVFF